MNVDDLTLGEVEEIENYAKVPLTSLTEGNPSTSLLIGIAWIMKRKTDPKFTVEHAKRLTMKDLNEILDIGDDAENPTKK